MGTEHISHYLSVMRIQKGLSIEQVLKKEFLFGSVFLTFTVFMSEEPSPPFKIGNENRRKTAPEFQHHNGAHARSFHHK